jgi:hypothetical protein
LLNPVGIIAWWSVTFFIVENLGRFFSFFSKAVALTRHNSSSFSESQVLLDKYH